MCDMVTGSLDRIINSGQFPWLLWRLGVTRYVIWKQKASYLVTTQVGRLVYSTAHCNDGVSPSSIRPGVRSSLSR